MGLDFEKYQGGINYYSAAEAHCCRLLLRYLLDTSLRHRQSGNLSNVAASHEYSVKLRARIVVEQNGDFRLLDEKRNTYSIA